MSRYVYDRMHNSRLPLSDAVIVITHKYPLPLFSHMTDAQSSFWTPARIAAVIGAVLLVVVTAGCTSSGPNTFDWGDIVAPAVAPESGAYVIVWYDRDTDQYTVDAVRKNPATGEWWRYADGFGREQKQIKDGAAYDKIMVKIDHDGGAAGTAGIIGLKK